MSTSKDRRREQPPPLLPGQPQEEKKLPPAHPFFAACRDGLLDNVRQMMRDATANSELPQLLGYREPTVNMMTPLHTACSNGRVAVVRVLLDSGVADVNAKGEGGITPLMLACIVNNAEVVSLLLAHPGIVATAKNDYQMSPLSIAASHCRHQVMRLLMVSGKVTGEGRLGKILQMMEEDPGIRKFEHYSESLDLMRRFHDSPEQTIKELQREDNAGKKKVAQ